MHAVPGVALCPASAHSLLYRPPASQPHSAPLLPPPNRLAHWGTLATEVLQATIGVINHRHMAPSHVGGQPAAAVVYLFYGSTALWMHGYSAFSMLPFHLLLAQQSLVVSAPDVLLARRFGWLERAGQLG